MSKLLHALIVEDSENDARLLARHLEQGGFKPIFTRVDTRETMHSQLMRKKWDIVFADFTMPQFNAFEALKVLQEIGQDLPFIIVSGTIGEDRAVQAMKAGAHDYILKDNMRRLVPAVDRELREARIRQERKRGEQMIRHLAFYDSLTNLPNRTLFRNHVQESIQSATQEKRRMALLLMDLQRFKEVNDTLGHQRGDQLLQQVGARLRHVIFRNDIVARLGGDEFGILLLNVSGMGDIEFIARKIRDVLEMPIVIDDVPIVVEASLGAVLVPEHGTDADALLQHADVAMYHAKHTGSGFAFYDPAQDPHNPRRLALMGELRQAIEHGQLQLHYQPKVDLKTGKMTGMEALVRWQHPKNGTVFPDQFIAPAENTGLIKPLTQWVLSTALRQCSELLLNDDIGHLAINLSVRSLHDLRFPNLVGDLLKETGAAPEKLMLEITESAFIVDLQRTVETLAVLNHMGIAISIDDFGTGFSSLNYIKKLPVNEIKIDKSFVIDMNTNESDLSIVQSIIDLGHNLGLKVVAEGVEDKTTLDSLTALGCDACQGFYISHPLPFEQLKSWTPAGSAG